MKPTHLDKDRRHEERLKESENNLKGHIRKLENRVSELQRLNDDFLHQKVFESYRMIHTTFQSRKFLEIKQQ